MNWDNSSLGVKPQDCFVVTERDKTMRMTLITRVHMRRLFMLMGVLWSKNDVISIAFVIYERCPTCVTISISSNNLH